MVVVHTGLEVLHKLVRPQVAHKVLEGRQMLEHEQRLVLDLQSFVGRPGAQLGVWPFLIVQPEDDLGGFGSLHYWRGGWKLGFLGWC